MPNRATLFDEHGIDRTVAVSIDTSRGQVRFYKGTNAYGWEIPEGPYRCRAVRAGDLKEHHFEKIKVYVESYDFDRLMRETRPERFGD